MKTIENKSNIEIAKEIGLHPAEISLALNGKRLLSRNKLIKIDKAGYDIKPFVFGKSYVSMPDIPVHHQVEPTEQSHQKESA
jgi:hypothetical protein